MANIGLSHKYHVTYNVSNDVSGHLETVSTRKSFMYHLLCAAYIEGEKKKSINFYLAVSYY